MPPETSSLVCLVVLAAVSGFGAMAAPLPGTYYQKADGVHYLNYTEPGCTGCLDESKFLLRQDYHGSDLIDGGIPDVRSSADCCSQCEESLHGLQVRFLAFLCLTGTCVCVACQPQTCARWYE